MNEKNMIRKILKTIIIFFVLVLLLLFTFIIILIVNFKTDQNKLASQIEFIISSYENGETESIDFRNIDYYDWDKIYFFGPYTSCELIEESTDSFYYNFSCSNITSNEDVLWFVFVKNGEPIGDYVIFYPNFYYPIGQKIIMREDTNFIVNEFDRLEFVQIK